MNANSIISKNRPEGVPNDIIGYKKPFFSILDESANKYPHNTYTIFQGGTRTFRQVRKTADRVAGFLVSRGIKKGDRVALFLPNIPQYPEIFFGVMKAGAICVTCNPLYTADELNFQLKDCGARIVFCMDHPDFYATTVKAISGTAVEKAVICNIKSYLPTIKGFLGGLLGKIPRAERHESGHRMFDDVIKSAAPLQIKPEIDPTEDLCMIVYTSGTTGKPKGACLTHATLVYAIRALDEWCILDHRDGKAPERLRRNGAHCFLGMLPWYHIFGLWISMSWSCLTGNRLVCIPDPRAGTPPLADAIQAIQDHKVTMAPAVPTIFTGITDHPLTETLDFSSLVACPSGAAPLPKETIARFEKKTGAVVFEGYGMSEYLPVSINPTSKKDRRIGSVGFPAIGGDVRILDIETGTRELPRGEEGEIAAAGPGQMKEYWQRPEANESDFRVLDGVRYFLTGDIGRFDEEGYLRITDRKKDMILVGGFNVYPAEVEDTLVAHPKVVLAAVVGVPNEDKGGEKVKAFVQIKPGETVTEEEIREYCEKSLAGYKRPRDIEFRNELPSSIVGKIIRRKLKE